jgi:hypothetical protein
MNNVSEENKRLVLRAMSNVNLSETDAATYAVAMLARKADYLKALAREIRQGGATLLDLSAMSAIARK